MVESYFECTGKKPSPYIISRGKDSVEPKKNVKVSLTPNSYVASATAKHANNRRNRSAHIQIFLSHNISADTVILSLGIN